MKVYIVISEDYSDFYLNAAFLDYKEAELYVAVHGGDRIEELETSDGQIKINQDDCVGYFYPTDGTGIQLREDGWHYRMLKSDGVTKSSHEGVWIPEENYEAAKRAYLKNCGKRTAYLVDNKAD